MAFRAFIFISLVACIRMVTCADNITECSANEEYSECRNTLCRALDCSQKGLPVACPSITKCETGCICKYGFLRHENGTCVEEDQCPHSNECSLNEEYSACKNGLCRALQCSQKGLPVACPSIAQCETGCVCKYGFLKNENGTCVAEDLCHDNVPTSCGANQEVQCVHDCPPQVTCANRYLATSCVTPDSPCTNKCVCRGGYARNSSGDCILVDQCVDVPSK